MKAGTRAVMSVKGADGLNGTHATSSLGDIRYMWSEHQGRAWKHDLPFSRVCLFARTRRNVCRWERGKKRKKKERKKKAQQLQLRAQTSWWNDSAPASSTLFCRMAPDCVTTSSNAKLNTYFSFAIRLHLLFHFYRSGDNTLKVQKRMSTCVCVCVLFPRNRQTPALSI